MNENGVVNQIQPITSQLRVESEKVDRIHVPQLEATSQIAVDRSNELSQQSAPQNQPEFQPATVQPIGSAQVELSDLNQITLNAVQNFETTTQKAVVKSNEETNGIVKLSKKTSDKSKKKDSLVGSKTIAPEKKPRVESKPNLQNVQSNRPQQIQQESKSILPNPSATLQIQQPVVRSNTPRQRILRPISRPENKPIFESKPSTNIVQSNRPQQIQQESTFILPKPSARQHLQQPVVRSNLPRQPIQNPISRLENKLNAGSQKNSKLQIVQSIGSQQMFKASQANQPILPRVKSQGVISSNENFLAAEKSASLWSMFFKYYFNLTMET